MESRHHGPQPLRPTSQAMPLGWRHTNGCVTHGGSGRMLLHEMLWQLEQRALQVQEQEFQYCISRGIMGYRHAPAYPSLLALIPASEHRQLERLCGRIPPSHTAIVLSRLHDLLANNDIPPWELVGVFKQVLRDFLRRQEDAMQRRPVPSAPPNILSAPNPPIESNDRNHMAGNASNSLSEESGNHREEIPTISSYVDKHLRAACPYSIRRDWSLPFCHPFAYEAYSTTL
ncbi:protein RD3-like [Pimephales promelas]|uniref:protein RD3-like n=1 Tax=Pimephales promelas TaxID=90988 RepID=UPI001955B263|nr:protein RD3-like [Pimephales promelas]XP_039548008.1 protein RD3-like [Pimephales promelas]